MYQEIGLYAEILSIGGNEESDRILIIGIVSDEINILDTYYKAKEGVTYRVKNSR